MGLQRTVEPDIEPITLAEAKAHLRVVHDSEDDAITELIIVARQDVESYLRRSLITQTWQLVLDGIPSFNELRLPRSPVQSVSSIQYVDTNGATQTWSSSLYRVASRRSIARIHPEWNQVWPTLRVVSESLIVTYVCGYDDSDDDNATRRAAVPARIKHGIKLAIANLYEQRESVVVGTITAELPQSIKDLLSPLRVKAAPGWFGLTE